MNDEQIKTALLVYSGRREARRAWSLVALAACLTLGLFAVLPFADLLAPRPSPDVTLRSFDTVKATIEPPPVVRETAPPPEKRETRKPDKPKLDMPQEWDVRQLNLAVALDTPDVGAATGDFSVRVPTVSAKPDSLAAYTPRIERSANLGLAFDVMDNPLAEALPEPNGEFDDHVFELADVDRPPKPTLQVPPEYPYRARRRGVEGSVELRFTVTRDGRVTAIDVVRAQPQHLFEESAKQAVTRWRFEPAMRDGKPVDVRVQVQLDFKL
jgi:protein TonB